MFGNKLQYRQEEEKSTLQAIPTFQNIPHDSKPALPAESDVYLTFLVSIFLDHF